jgi:hypothetical protein
MTHNDKIATVNRLSKMGGFYEALGKAWLLADNSNQERLERAFPEYCVKHEAKIRLVWTL